VCIEDDGVGFDAESFSARPGHLGLVSSEPLILAVGGWYHVVSMRSRGTRVEFWVPAATGAV
jgi:signal transduction histidine kinase